MKDKHDQDTQELPLETPDADVLAEEYDENGMVIRGYNQMEIYQPKVEAMKRMHDIYMEAVSNGQVKMSTHHYTPDGKKWLINIEQILHPEEKVYNWYGVATNPNNMDIFTDWYVPCGEGWTLDEFLKEIRTDLDEEWE